MMKRKIVVVLGSPRRQGNSATLAAQLTAGAEARGAEVESFYLHGMDIRPCSACGWCQDEPHRDCNIADDMRLLYPKLREADAIVIAGPIYWFTVSAQTKLFMDRCHALGGPEGNALAGKQFGILLAYADPDPFISGAVNALRAFQDSFRHIGAEIVGMVYGSASAAGEIAANEHVMQQAYDLGQQLAVG